MALLLEYIFSFLYDYRFLLFVNLFSIGLKGYGLACLYSKPTHSQKTLYLRIMLSVGLLCGMVVDSAWVMVLCRRLDLISLSHVFGLGYVRFSWVCSFIYYQAIALFIRYITQQEGSIQARYYFFFIPLLLTTCVYMVYMIINYKNTEVKLYEEYMRLAGQLYGTFVLIIPSIIHAAKTIKRNILPRILKLQIRWTLLAFVTPFIITELITLFSDHLILMEERVFHFLSSMSTIFLSIGIYLTGKRTLQLRFLNLESKVMSAPRATFATEMKNISDVLNSTTSPSGLSHVVKTFFKDAFGIPLNRTHFYINNDPPLHIAQNNSNRRNAIETFLIKHKDVIAQQLKQHEILVMDELVFSNFYNHDPVQEEFINLLESINADLFLPIFKHNTVVASIIVDRYARQNQLYSNVESDEMVVFASCIGNLVNILQNKNLEVVVEREQAIREQLHLNQKSLQEELYHKHQENNRYRESLRSFLRNSQQREIGILFYKNRRFSFANRAAKEIITIDINNCLGHPLVKAITRTAREVEEYRNPQSCLVKNTNGKRLVISAVPSLERNSVIVTAYPPEVSDFVKKQIDLLKEPRNWDYLLYLETTKSGRLINELIPGHSESILNFKIELLKTALSRQATLINAPQDDVMPMVNILHQISLRDTLHVIKIHEPLTSSHTALKLFGANKLLYPKMTEPPLLKKLDKVGTLLIENVQYLTLDAQKKLAEYILYGYFNPMHSEEKIASDVRIICSTNQNLKLMESEGTFDTRLFSALQKTSVEMPSLADLDSEEFRTLAEHIASHSIKKNELASLINLSEKDKDSITNERPTSLIQLQHKIRTILARKSKKSPIAYDSNLDIESTTDPVISQALQLGKKALRNEKIMRALWDKFKSQAKIATLLGVNRSSVNRRCRAYNLVNY